MLKEEFRTHATYSGRGRFLSFPGFVFALAFITGLTLESMLETITLEELAVFAHLSAFLYGLSVGAFGIMGRQYLERRYGSSNYIVAMPFLLPLSFRTTFLGIFLRDALFYVLLLIVPACGGLVLAAPLAGFSFVSVGLFFAAALLTFMLGLSISFLASVVYIRSVKAFIGFTAFIAVLFSLQSFLEVPGLERLIPALGFQLSIRPFPSDPESALLYLAVSLGATLLMTLAAYALVEIRIDSVTRDRRSVLPGVYGRVPVLTGRYKALFAKEFVDLRRSGTVAKMAFSFVLPLLFLSFTAWFVNNGLDLPIGFNSVFYAAMVGFVGVLMYSWLNNVDLPEYYSLLPVTVPQLIRIRILVFLVLTLGISALFVIGISVLNGDVELLWLALVVMFVTSLYMVVMTAYLTGIRTNTFLFDTSILIRFSVLSFLPDLGLAILSFSLLSDWMFALAGIALVLGSMLVATRVLYRGIEGKWRWSTFSS